MSSEMPWKWELPRCSSYHLQLPTSILSKLFGLGWNLNGESNCLVFRECSQMKSSWKKCSRKFAIQCRGFTSRTLLTAASASWRSISTSFPRKWKEIWSLIWRSEFEIYGFIYHFLNFLYQGHVKGHVSEQSSNFNSRFRLKTGTFIYSCFLLFIIILGVDDDSADR